MATHFYLRCLLCFKPMAIAFVLLLLPACVSGPGGSTKESDPRDIPMSAAQEPSLAPGKVLVAEAGASPSQTAAPAVDEPWQEFFKPLPSQQERPRLEENLHIIEAAKDSLPALLKKARNERALGHIEKAEASYQGVLRQHPQHAAALIELAIIAIAKKEAQKAFAWLDEARKSFSKKESAPKALLFEYRYALAHAYLLAGESQKGHAILSDLIAVDKAFTPAYMALAASYLSQGKLDIAEFIVQRALERAQEEASLFNVLGVIAEQRGQWEKSLEHYEKSLSLSPQFVPAMVNQAMLHIKRRDFELAEKLLKEALALNPSHGEAQVALAIIYTKKDNIADAKALLEKTIATNPYHVSARYNLALLTLYKLKQPYDALRLFNEVYTTSGQEYEDIKKLSQAFIDDIKSSQNLRDGV